MTNYWLIVPGATVVTRKFLSEPLSCFELIWKHYRVSYQNFSSGFRATVYIHTWASKSTVKMSDDSFSYPEHLTCHPLAQCCHVPKTLHFTDDTRVTPIHFPLALEMPPSFPVKQWHTIIQSKLMFCANMMAQIKISLLLLCFKKQVWRP